MMMMARCLGKNQPAPMTESLVYILMGRLAAAAESRVPVKKKEEKTQQ